jgi:hypothetical protein
VELFEEIRREYEFGIGTIVGVAKKLKVHRRMVREAIGTHESRRGEHGKLELAAVNLRLCSLGKTSPRVPATDFEPILFCSGLFVTYARRAKPMIHKRGRPTPPASLASCIKRDYVI